MFRLAQFLWSGLVSIDSIGHIELTSGQDLNASVHKSIIDICKYLSTSKSSGCFSAFVFRTAIFIQARFIILVLSQTQRIISLRSLAVCWFAAINS